MLLNLKEIADKAGSVPFQAELDLSDLRFGTCCPIQEPVKAEGRVVNSADVLRMTGNVRAVLHGVCDRCAKEFTRTVDFPLQALLVDSLEDESDEDEWTFCLEDQCADLTDIITSTVVLNMDTQLLCKEDCKGLCFRCGKDLNDGPCDCQPETDPRLAVLQKLLDR